MRKIAVSGKGGVGKSTLAASLAYVYSERGVRVYAIDADPDGNLAAALGIPSELAAQITPISEMDSLIFERTGAKPGSSGTFFRLNPRVDDIPERFSVEHNGIRLLVMGSVTSGGSGCVCPESALLRALVTHLTLHRDEVVILDMEAGVEHLGRATASAVDAFIVVVEPGLRSIQTANAVRALAHDIGVTNILAVGNKVRNERDRQFLREQLADIPVLGFIPFMEDIIEADLTGSAAYLTVPTLAEAVRAIVQQLEE
ncbi:MAG: AAA family ATPase [Anaerolineae bacterium]|nr:AAA family ATPase [Anaerolineae bacterium]